MGLALRHPLSAAIVVVAVALTAGFFVFARPAYHPQHPGKTIRLPDKTPAVDVSSARGWVWPDGLPGWEPGYTVRDTPVTGVQPVEVEAAQLAAAHAILDSTQVRVIDAMRPDYDGPLAILAAPGLYETPAQTCLAALLRHDAPVVWECPGATPAASDLAHAHVLVAAAALKWRMSNGSVKAPLYLVGVARGDVRRVVIHTRQFAPRTIYTRGKTWGQFDSAAGGDEARATLLVYGDHGLVETVAIRLRPGRQAVFR